jgi:hypothetical protein
MIKKNSPLLLYIDIKGSYFVKIKIIMRAFRIRKQSVILNLFNSVKG